MKYSSQYFYTVIAISKSGAEKAIEKGLTAMEAAKLSELIKQKGYSVKVKQTIKILSY